MSEKKAGFKFWVFALLVVFAATDNLFCAAIRGNIKDSSKVDGGTNLTDITVTLTGSSTTITTTNSLGNYEFTDLPVGRYTVTPSSAGRIFQPGHRIFNIVLNTTIESAQDFSGVEYVFVTKWGLYGTNYGKFKLPSGIAVSSISYVYVADTENHRIQRFSSSGTAITDVETNKWGAEEGGVPVSSAPPYGFGFNKPFDVAIDSAGWLYVADTYNNCIQKFDPEDENNNEMFWGLPDATTGFFDHPQGICSDNSDDRDEDKKYNFYVADTDNNRILQFSSTGYFLNEWGSFGTGNGQFKHPRDVAVDADGNIYVADTDNHRIQKFYDMVSDSSFKQGSGPKSDDGEFNQPTSIAVDLNGDIYVSDTVNNRVQKFTSAGDYITKWGYYGTGNGCFDTPYGIAVDSDNFVYVSEHGNNHRIQKFAPASSFVNISGFATFQVSPTDGINDVIFVLRDSGVIISTFVTGPDGYYEFLNLPVKGNYTVTPSSAGFIFSPVSLSTPSITESLNDWDFVGISSIPIYNIQGYIKQKDSEPPNQPMQDVIVYLSGSLVGVSTTTDQGLYLFESLSSTGHYTVTPYPHDNIKFEPLSISTASLSGNIGDWNFSGFVVASIKGYVKDDSGTGIAGVAMTLSDSVSTVTYTDSSGYYEFLDLPKSGHYTVTPSKPFYSFDPVNKSFTNTDLPTTSGAADFKAINKLGISGYIKTAGGAGINSVTVSLSVGSTATFTTAETNPGYFEFSGLMGGTTYTVTPSLIGYLFSPTSYSTACLTSSITDCNFVGVSSIVYIQGTIKHSKDSETPGQPIEDIVVYLTGTVTSSFTTTAEGVYLFNQLPAERQYTVTPSDPDLGFEPLSISTPSLLGNVTDWNFVGFAATSISGHVKGDIKGGVNMCLLYLSNGSTAAYITASDGYYEFKNLPDNSSYTVTPSKMYYSFDPSQRKFSDIAGDNPLPSTAADFTSRYIAPPANLNITGYIKEKKGTGVGSVTVSLSGGSTGTFVTDNSNSGFFKFSGLKGRKNYTLTPSKLNWNFTPSSSTIELSDSDKAVDFIAACSYTEAPPKIDIPLGSNGAPVQVQLPDAGAAKVIVEERPGKAAKYRGSVNPDKNEAVGILFKPSVNFASYFNKKFTIRIFSLKGELVNEFSKTPQTADDVWIKWIPKDLASGIYIIHIEGPGVNSTKKIAILK